MSAKKTAIRAASMLFMFGGGGLYAMQSGLVPGTEPAPSPAVQQGASAAASVFSVSQPAPAAAPVVAQAVTAPAAPTAPVSAPAPTAVAAIAPTPVATPTPLAPAIPTVSDTVGIALPRQAVIPITATEDDAPAQPPLPQAPDEDTAATEPALSPFGLPCDLSVGATAMPGAMVALNVMAPCQPDARVEIAHSGLTLTGKTDIMGLLIMDIPAFEAPAFFTVELPDGSTDSTLVGVPDLGLYDRAAVQWVQDRELELHAMELGAEFGGPGHIWEQTPGSVEATLEGDTGFLMEIGDTTVDTPRVAQIYTFPRDTLRAGDSVRLSVDAPITERNCGQPIEAHTVQMSNGGRVSITELSMTMPGCDAIGDYLVLQNLLQDLRLASN